LALKKSPDQSRSPKAGQIFPCKLFGNGLYFLIVNLIFLRYTFLPLLSKCYVNKFNWLEGSSIGSVYLKFVTN